jgi:hypothetical protein
MWSLITRPLQYLLSTPETHKHLYAENYISISRDKGYGRNIGSWVKKAYKDSPVYMQKAQVFKETWREITSGHLIREITALTIDDQKVFCAPKISLNHSYFGGQIFTLSMALDGFINLAGNIVSVEEERYHFLRKIENFPEVIAACFLTGQFDLHGGNLGLLQRGEKQYMAKVDHGRAFDQYTSRTDPSEFLTSCMRDYVKFCLPPALFFSAEFADGLESIAHKANDQLIISSLVQGFNKIYRNGAVSLCEEKRIKSMDMLLDITRLNKYNLLNMAKFIRLRQSIIEGDVSAFSALLNSPWYFFNHISDLCFCVELTFGVDIHPSAKPIPVLIENLAPAAAKADMLKEYEVIANASKSKDNMVDLPPLSMEDQQFLEEKKEQLDQIRQAALKREKRIFQARTTSLIFGGSVLASAVFSIPPIVTQALGVTASYLWSVKNESNFGTYLMAAGAALHYAGWSTLSLGLMGVSGAILITNVLQTLLRYEAREEGTWIPRLSERKRYWLSAKLSEYSAAINYGYNKEKTA